MTKIICTVTNDLTFDQRMIRICSSLVKAGYSVELVGRRLPNSSPIVLQPFRQKRFRLLFKKGKLFYLEFNVRLFIFLLFARFDIICSVDLDTLAAGFVVSRVRRKICVFDAHEYFTEVPEVVERAFVKKAWELLARLVIPKIQHAYTVSQSLTEIFQEKYGTTFSIIRNLPVKKIIPTEYLKKSDPFILIYQGALNEGRGLEETIEAMTHLDDVELWLAGEGDLSGQLRQLAAKRRVGKKVKFLGRMLPSELALLTPKAHLGLNLLKNTSLSYYFSLANKTFDYVQAGIPSLNMDFPEYRKLNQEHEVFYLLEKLEVEALVKAVDFLRTKVSVYEKLSANCAQAAQEWTWEKEEKKLLEFYRRLRPPIAR